MQRALTRIRKVSKTEGTKTIIDKGAKASDLNMAEELFNFIKDAASEEGYSVPEGSK